MNEIFPVTFSGYLQCNVDLKLAKYLLRNDPFWPEIAIRNAMNNKTEKWVSLGQPLPVFITYFTCWADNERDVYFRNDIYGHDKTLEKHLFE
jgi:murein L,D-transpeptidase YcbB/YkuD